MAKKQGFNSLFTPSVTTTDEKKMAKLHCMIDEDLKKQLDIYAIKNGMKIKDVVSQAIVEFIK